MPFRWNGPGTDRRGQDCDGTQPSGSYEVTSRPPPGQPDGRHVTRKTRGHSGNESGHQAAIPHSQSGKLSGARFFLYISGGRDSKMLVPQNMPLRHKSQRVQVLLNAQGNALIFLPPYSPDLNPIEMAFSKLKTLLRKGAARTYEALWKLVGSVCDLFPPKECQNYFKAAGYGGD